MTRVARLAVLAALGVAGACRVAAAGEDPLADNLRRLQQRAAPARPRATAPAPARPAASRRRAPAVVARATPVRRIAEALRPGPVRSHTRYHVARLGTRAGTGDLQVFAPIPNTTVHVYLGQQLVSHEGDGQARVENLKPAKYPVMIWAPSRTLRKVYWVSIRPDQLTTLEPTL